MKKMKNRLTHVAMCDTHTHTHTLLSTKGGAWLNDSQCTIIKRENGGEWRLNHSLGDDCV